jgi:alpha-tubulin suppressor-like RCC1 family protein
VVAVFLAMVPLGIGRAAYAQTVGPSVYQWGYTERTITPVAGLPADVVSVQAGDWGGMALDATGHVWDWGYGSQGELGDGLVVNSFNTAVEAKGPHDIVSIGEGDNYAAAVDRSGNLWVWGYDPQGALCLSHRSMVIRPVKIAGLGATAIAGGGAHLLILLRNGTVEACGEDKYGQLGDGTIGASSASPVAVAGLSHVVSITAGNLFSAAVESDGSVWTWGYNAYGQLGLGTTTNDDLPQKVPLPLPATEVYAGGDNWVNGHMVAILSDGAVMAWGNDIWGQLGNRISGASFSTPQTVDVPSGVKFAYVAAGGEDTFALDTGGDLWAWGRNTDGELGVAVRGRVVVRPILAGHGFTMISVTAVEGVGLSSGP